jgi:hypothetical protein
MSGSTSGQRLAAARRSPQPHFLPEAGDCGILVIDVIYGLVAAAGWGLSAVAAMQAATRAGTYLAVLSGQGIGVVVLLVLIAILRPSFAAVDGHVAATLAGRGSWGFLAISPSTVPWSTAARSAWSAPSVPRMAASPRRWR